jgi:hypothetical protein
MTAEVEDKVYQITPLNPSSIKITYTMIKVKGITERIARIDEWYRWGRGRVLATERLDVNDSYIKCNVELGCELDDCVAVSYNYSGDEWTDKDRHRIQKDYVRGGVEKIQQNDPDWHIKESALYIDAPFQVDLISKPMYNHVIRSHVREPKKSSKQEKS